ncbi:MAG: molybdopterin-dependent oxidoreductase, partial [Myxococcales bacterium]|nr:molybdopterin-dependent oxidoreductase [Myxococcales bacterium]
YAGNPNVHSLAGPLYFPVLARALGSRNIFSASTVDQMPRHVASGWLFGHPDRIPVPDIDRTDLLIIVGANPAVSNGSLATAPDWPGRLASLRGRGGRVVVIDPRRTETAALADEHLPIRPGTDAALLLAMAQCLFADGRVNLGACAAFVDGIDATRDAIAAFAPERVAPVCGVAAEDIRRLAHALADTPRAVVYGRIGTHATRFGTLAAWAVDVLNIMTGHLDVPGGAMFPQSLHERTAPAKARGFQTGRHRSRVGGHPEVRGELPCVALLDEITTPGKGQIRALFVVGGNPVLSVPGGDRLAKALDSLDLMVSVDPYLNETSRHAHVILPPPSPLAKAHYDLAFYGLAVRNFARYSAPVVPAAGPSEAEILARLALLVFGMGPKADPKLVDAQVLGFILEKAAGTPGSPVFGRDAKALAAELPAGEGTVRALDALIRTGPRGDGFGANPEGWTLARLAAAPSGVDFGPLEPRLPDALSTPDGRIGLMPAPIAADLPRLEALLHAPRDGLLLIGRRHLRSNNSWLHNLKKLAAGRDRQSLRLHPDDAAAAGIAAGDRVRVAAVDDTTACADAIAQVTDEMMPGVVSLPHGWGHGVEGTGLRVAAAFGGPNVNRITRPVLDPLSGTAALNGVPVTIERLP